MIMLETKDLSIGYDKKIVINNINIKVNCGEILCLLGSNGSGKTTTLRTLSGLLKAIGGKVFLKDKDITCINKKEFAKKMALVLTSRFQGSLMTVYDIASMGRYPHTGFLGKLSDKDKEIVFEALRMVGADKLAERYFDELSDGEKQKVLVARALVQEPEIIILDEPTSHLDIKHRLELMGILKTLSKKKNIAVILSLHEIDIALKSCDKVMLMKDNKIVAYGEPEDVVTEQILNSLYDLDNKNYNNLLGAVEIKNSNNKQVFVVGGAGTAAPIFRAFAKKEIGVYAGIIHKNDVDYEIGRTMGINMYTEEAFKEIGQETVDKALNSIENINYVIDSGFPVGNINYPNIEIIIKAIKGHKKVYSIREHCQGERLFKELNCEIIYKDNISSIVKEINDGVKNVENI